MLTTMRKTLLATIFVVTFSAFTFGQNSNCPTISVTGPSATVQAGETMAFTVSIEGKDIDFSELNYQWSVDKGTIIEGQGERTILVSTEELNGEVITATVNVKGVTNGCVSSDSESGVVTVGCGYSLVDEFGKLPKNDEKARLDVLAAELMANKEFIAYIILYHPANKKSYENKVARIRNVLVKDRGISSERIVFISGGVEKEELVRIFMIPVDSPPPTP